MHGKFNYITVNFDRLGLNCTIKSLNDKITKLEAKEHKSLKHTHNCKVAWFATY